MSRRAFVQVLGAGLLITVTEEISFGQRRGGEWQPSARNVAARLHINQDGTITVMTGKVEEGQGSRAQLTQAAAEELRVDVAQDHAGDGRHGLWFPMTALPRAAGRLPAPCLRCGKGRRPRESC